MTKKIRYKVVFNRAKRLNKRGEGLIQIECLLGGRRIYFSTHTYVKPEQFSNGLIINHPNANGLNAMLYSQKCDIEKVEIEFFKRDMEVSLSMLKDAVRSNISPAAKLSDFGMQVVEESEKKT